MDFEQWCKKGRGDWDGVGKERCAFRNATLKSSFNDGLVMKSSGGTVESDGVEFRGEDARLDLGERGLLIVSHHTSGSVRILE